MASRARVTGLQDGARWAWEHPDAPIPRRGWLEALRIQGGAAGMLARIRKRAATPAEIQRAAVEYEEACYEGACQARLLASAPMPVLLPKH